MVYLNAFLDIERELKPEIRVLCVDYDRKGRSLKILMLPCVGRQRRRSLLVLKVEELIMEK